MSDDKEGRGEDRGAKKEPNVKPNLDSKGSFNWGTSEIQRKASKLLRRSRSNDSENHYRESQRGREQDRKQDGKKPRGRSEERRKPHYDPEPNNPKQVTDDLEDIECIVCFCTFDNVFKAPKLLSCGHTFCLECLARINVNSAELKMLTCPICREPTQIRHGRDLPHLGNNEDIFRKLPPDMQRVLSVRFQRSKGKLVLKNPSGPIKTTLNLPVFKKKEEQVHNYPIEAMEEGLGSTTMINVGRPPSRMRSQMRRFLYSNQCYYTTVAGIIAVTLALMLVGIFTFVIMPHVKPIGSSGINQTTSKP